MNIILVPIIGRCVHAEDRSELSLSQRIVFDVMFFYESREWEGLWNQEPLKYLQASQAFHCPQTSASMEAMSDRQRI